MRISDWSSDVCSSDLKLRSKNFNVGDAAPPQRAKGLANEDMLDNPLPQGRVDRVHLNVGHELSFCRLVDPGRATSGAAACRKYGAADRHLSRVVRALKRHDDPAKIDRKSTRLNSSH